jgi:hypothetical protein
MRTIPPVSPAQSSHAKNGRSAIAYFPLPTVSSLSAPFLKPGHTHSAKDHVNRCHQTFNAKASISMHKYTGGCHCGNLRLTAWLPARLASYNPRVCDCDFCRMHAASYLSDPGGRLEVSVKDDASLTNYKQGGNLASFMICKICGVLAAVCYEENGILYAAVNTKAMHDDLTFGEAKTVSPKLLSNDEKTKRWLSAWFPQVSITNRQSP